MYSVNAESVAYDVFVQNILSVPDLFNDTSACPYTSYTYTWYHIQSSWADIEIWEIWKLIQFYLYFKNKIKVSSSPQNESDKCNFQTHEQYRPIQVFR